MIIDYNIVYRAVYKDNELVGVEMSVIQIRSFICGMFAFVETKVLFSKVLQ